MDPEAIYYLLKHGTAAERQGFVRSLPPSPFRDLSISMIESNGPGMVVVALGPSITSYCAGSAPDIGAPLALATHRFAVELFETTPDHGLLATTLSGLASSYTNASNLLGRSYDVLKFTEEYIPYYERLGERENLPSLKLVRVSALLNLNRMDEAAEALDDPTLPGNPATDLELERLRGLMARLREKVTADQPRTLAVAPKSSGDDFPARARAALAELTVDLPGSGEPDRLRQGLGGSKRLDPNDPAGFSQLLDLLKKGEEFLARGTSGDNELTIRRRIREASGIFVLDKQPPPDRIRTSLAELEESLAWARANGIVELENDALYGIYLCQSRLDDPSKAADALLPLIANLEEARSGIADPLERGGAFSTYPHLFAALCEKLRAAERIPEMLEVIEASKGRGIADLLAARKGRPITDPNIYREVKRLPELCAQHRFHYVTYFVDDDRTYPVVVTSSGRMLAPDPVPLSRKAIRVAVSHVDPRDWGEPSDDGSGVLVPDAAAALSPLVTWIEALVKDGMVARGDHLCIAPDDDLANVPFAYLYLDGRPLAETLSTSRIQNAYHLAHVLEDGGIRPAEYLGIMVPTRQNVVSPSWQRMRSNLLGPLEYLAAQLPGEVVSLADATIACLQARPLRDRVLHFSTHGIFPRKREDSEPFEHAGLVLADGESLPDESIIADGGLDTVLTPQRVLEARLDLTGSHVSMMACVSGLSREGMGGDALGMEWAMIQAGAASVLSSHWYVSAETAAAFLRRFYVHWIQGGQSRRKALTETMADLQASAARQGETASWAAFSLTGDWR
jgi:tetratricopeptide (TPR) repeat protein